MTGAGSAKRFSSVIVSRPPKLVPKMSAVSVRSTSMSLVPLSGNESWMRSSIADVRELGPGDPVEAVGIDQFEVDLEVQIERAARGRLGEAELDRDARGSRQGRSDREGRQRDQSERVARDRIGGVVFERDLRRGEGDGDVDVRPEDLDVFLHHRDRHRHGSAGGETERDGVDRARCDVVEVLEVESGHGTVDARRYWLRGSCCRPGWRGRRCPRRERRRTPRADRAASLAFASRPGITGSRSGSVLACASDKLASASWLPICGSSTDANARSGVTTTVLVTSATVRTADPKLLRNGIRFPLLLDEPRIHGPATDIEVPTRSNPAPPCVGQSRL